MARHGPMVLSVCRGILRDPGDAEDAFQATFLVMVRKAATIRGRQVLGGWLYQVAHRVAIQANKATARRRAREREGGLMASARTASGPALIDELLSALHDEIARLPEKHRLAVVLCELEGKTHNQAAVELNWSERTLRRRLAERASGSRPACCAVTCGSTTPRSGPCSCARSANRRTAGLEQGDRRVFSRI